MIPIHFLKKGQIIIEPPMPTPEVQSTPLSDSEIWAFLIITALITILAIAVTLYFSYNINKQIKKDKISLINNQKENSKILITPNRVNSDKSSEYQ